MSVTTAEENSVASTTVQLVGREKKIVHFFKVMSTCTMGIRTCQLVVVVGGERGGKSYTWTPKLVHAYQAHVLRGGEAIEKRSTT